MINNLTFAITEKCNGRCKMCQIWKNGSLNELSLNEISNLLSQECFKNVETISISGGEPFLRKDIMEVIGTIHKTLPKLNRIFLNTNGTLINKVVEVSKYCCSLVPNVILSISLEGNKEINKIIRGIDTYDNVVNLVKLIQHEAQNVFVCLSMTLTNDNCDLENLNHIKNLSERIKCGYSFRFADNSDEFYKNGEINLEITKSKKKIVSEFIKENVMDNEFLRVLKEYIDTSKISILFDKNNNNLCLAGKEFAFIKSNGEITPCLYSSRILGSLEKKFDNKDLQLGDYEKCPCCTDCTIYPIIEFMKRGIVDEYEKN